jgi:PAS domain S-box-containing protein
MREIFETPGTVRRISWRIRHRNGGWRHYEAIGRTIDPHSAERGAVCNARDVTERLEAQEALRRSEEHFRRLIENGSDLLMISRADGPLTYVSPSAERLLGYHPSEILGKVPDDLTHPDDVDGVWEGLRRVAEAPGSVHPIALRLRHKDGSWRALEALARTVSPHSADEGIVANSRDVTAQRAAERALQESEAKYRSVVDAAQDMITVIDAEGVVQFQSPSAARILGFAPEEMVGRNVMEFLHPDDVPMAVERLGKVITNPGTVECVQYRSLCKDGSYRHVESTGRTVLPDSAAAGAVGIVRDITARIEAEAALRQARADAERAHAEAERANRAKSEFLSRMSHELRTPLNSILGFAQLLEGVALEPDYQTGVGYILAGGRHLLTLIDEVLDISRIEAGEHAMSLEPVRVLDAVREAVDLVRPLAAARGVHIVEAVGAHAAAYVRADRQRLTQVLLNLLSNAVKYNRPGGCACACATRARGSRRSSRRSSSCRSRGSAPSAPGWRGRGSGSRSRGGSRRRWAAPSSSRRAGRAGACSAWTWRPRPTP